MAKCIKVNGVVWTVVNERLHIIQRYGLTARLIWRGPNHGVMLTRHVVNGRMRSQKFVAM